MTTKGDVFISALFIAKGTYLSPAFKKNSVELYQNIRTMIFENTFKYLFLNTFWASDMQASCFFFHNFNVSTCRVTLFLISVVLCASNQEKSI